jgi:hypothetical protein
MKRNKIFLRIYGLGVMPGYDNIQSTPKDSNSSIDYMHLIPYWLVWSRHKLSAWFNFTFRISSKPDRTIAVKRRRYCPDIYTVHAMLKLDAELYDNVMLDMGTWGCNHHSFVTA